MTRFSAAGSKMTLETITKVNQTLSRIVHHWYEHFVWLEH